MPMRFNYVSRPELLDAPHMKKIQEEDEILCQLAQDFIYLQEGKKAEKQARAENPGLRGLVLSGVDDIFTESLSSVLKTGIVTMRSVFASRLLLDIHQICPDFNGEKLLRDEGHRQEALFEFRLDDGSLDTQDGIRWHRKDQELVLEIYHRIQDELLEPKFPTFKQSFLEEAATRNESPMTGEDTKSLPPERHIHASGGSLKPGVHDDKPGPDEATKERYRQNAKRLSIHAVRANPDPALYINKNLLFCGTLILSQIVSTEVAGIALANHHESIFNVAHLYNAFRKMQLIDIVWPDMERIITLHAGPIFANDIPNTPEEMQDRLFFRVGRINRSMTRFNTSKKTETKKNLTISPSGAVLLEFFQAKQPLEKTVYQLQENIERTKLARKSHNITTAVSLLSQRKFIDQLEDFAKSAISETEIPYLSLTRTCVHLPEGMAADLEVCGYKPERRSNPGESKNDNLAFTTAKILMDNSYSSMEGIGAGPMLTLAATTFRTWWYSHKLRAIEG